MKVIRCQNGHFYDSDLYSNCPHCKQEHNNINENVKVEKKENKNEEKSTEKKKKKLFGFNTKKEKSAPAPENKKIPEGNKTIVSYTCEPTQALSASELAILFDERNGTEKNPGGANAMKESPSMHISADAEEKNKVASEIKADITVSACENKKRTSSSMQVTSETEVNIRANSGTTGDITTDASNDNKDVNESDEKIDEKCDSNNKKTFVCPETVGWYSADAGDREPCVGWLCAVSGPYRGKSFELKAGGNFIGRAPGNDIVLADDNRVSRHKHARIAYEPRTGEFYIEVGESSGLAYLNGKNILHHAALSTNDIIEIGGGTYIFVPLCSNGFSWDLYPKAFPICRGTLISGGKSL